MSWEVRYRSSVEKDIARLPQPKREEVLGLLISLQTDPFAAGCKKLKGQKRRFRLRVAGDYRIVYTVFQDERVIMVEYVGHRKDAYRWF